MDFMRKKIFILALALLSFNFLSASEVPWHGEGRIAISSDGNDHDDDDWAATPVSLAILCAKGLQDKLAVYTYSDHIWGNNTKLDGYGEMQESALKGAEYFSFDKSRFICAVDDPQKAYEAMAKAINDSSEHNPLFIIGAGPMQVIGEAIKLSDKDKLQYVSLTSHSKWNDNHGKEHGGWTLDMIEKEFTQYGLTIFRILDQNGNRYTTKAEKYEGIFADVERFDWLKTSPAKDKAPYKAGSWDWLYSRLESCKRGINKKRNWTKPSFDASDSGMLIFLLTGEEKTNVDMLKEILENPVGASSLTK